MDYGQWVYQDERGVTSDVPGHNSLYKRSALLELGDLDELMRADTIMHAEFRARGQELFLEPAARVDHLNVSRFRWALIERFESGRTFAGMRARGWAWPRRVAYALGSRSFPWCGSGASAYTCAGAATRPRCVRLAPVLGLALAVSAFGEFVGYLFGRGKTRQHLRHGAAQGALRGAPRAGGRGRQKPLAALTR